jgi:putative membrane protein
MIDYDSHDWRSHLLDVKGSMVREIIGRVSACVGWSVLVVTFHKFVAPVAIPSTVHGLVGLAVGLLLVFRTNASYDRFWEGRKLWGRIVNESRNLARAASLYLRDDPDLSRAVIGWTSVLAHVVKHNLRGAAELGPFGQRLPEAEVKAALESRNVPMHVASRLTTLLIEARSRGLISDYVLIQLDQNVQLLVDYLGGCQRISKTPLPFAYVVHLRRALILYCFSLPFALVADFGWGTVLDTLMVAYIFFGIEEIGVEIEHPFGLDDNDLPLEAICATIDADLATLIEENASQVVPDASPILS